MNEMFIFLIYETSLFEMMQYVSFQCLYLKKKMCNLNKMSGRFVDTVTIFGDLSTAPI